MEFRLLGPVEVEEGGRTLSLGGRRQRAVLAHLLLHAGTPVTSDWLIEQVWADAAPAAVRTSLHTYVSRIRSALGADRLETRSTGYLLHARPEEVDARRFEALLADARSADRHGTVTTGGPGARPASHRYDEALALWRGPALGDLAHEASLQPSAARLDALREVAVSERLGALVAEGDVAALTELEDLLRRDPLREDLWVRYVLGLYLAGRQADALAAYDRVRRLLRDSLGVEPSEPLRALHARVLRQDPGLAGRPALHGYQLLGVLGQGPSAVVHRAVQPHVGREVALKVLRPGLVDDPAVVRRFEAAAESAARLEHPHVVPVHDYWREPGGACVVMRLLRGGTLEDLLRRGPVDLAAALRLVEHVARAREAFVRHGTAAGDTGPSDVLLDDEGNGYLSAFSLTRSLSPAAVAPADDDQAHPSGTAAGAEVALLGRLLSELLAAVPDPPPAVLDLAARASSGGPAAPPGVGQLLDELRTSSAPAVPQPRRPEGRRALRNPYKGLRSFQEADAADFFGRTDLVDRLVARLSGPDEGTRLLAVVGPSGSGKSSAVRAGLLPALRRGPPPDGSWYVTDLVPGTDPFAELETALRRVAVVPLTPAASAALRSDPHGLAVVADAVLPADGRPLLLVVDQFEELFTLVDAEDRRDFVAALVGATSPPGRVRVVLTLRADFYDRPLGIPALAELLRSSTELVVPLTPEGLEQAVVEPAERVGVPVDPALIAQVVADVGTAASSLPLLQYALTELFDRRREDVLTLADYRAVGGVSGALVRRADAVHARLTPGQQRVARQLLLQLVQPDAAGTDTRRRVPLSELVRRTDDADAAQAVVDAFGAARLLSFDREPTTRAPTVEVAHEALLQEWSLVRGWLDRAREDLRTERRLAAAAREWDESGRDRSFLAAGTRLAALELWLARWSADVAWAPTPLEQDFLEASRDARDEGLRREAERDARELQSEQRSVRRLRAVAALLALAVVAATGLAAFGFTQQRRAERESLVSLVRALAAAAVASLDEDPERSLLLALEAVRRSPREGGAGGVLPEAEDALHRALVASRLVLTVPGTGGAADWSATGLLVTEGPEGSGRIDLRHSATGDRVRAFPGHDQDVNAVAFSPDGSRLLTTGDDGAARLWDPQDGRLLWQLEGDGRVWGPSFSRDGRRLAAAWQDEGVVRVLDVATGVVLRELRPVASPRATALTADGGRAVVSGWPDLGAVVLDVATGAELLRIADAPDTAAYGVAVSPDDSRLATWGADGRARLWALADGAALGTLYSSAPIGGLDWSSDSRRVVLGGQDGVARVFEVADEGIREGVRLTSSSLRGITGVAFSPDDGHVVIGDTSTTTTQVWDVRTSGSREWLTLPVPARSDVAADFTADGRHLLTSTTDGALAVRALRDGRVLRSTPGYAGTVWFVRRSPDGALVAGFTGGAARVWRVDTAEEVFSVPLDSGGYRLGWSHEGDLLGITDGDGRLHVVDRDGTSVPSAQDPDVLVASVDWAADGVQLRAVHPVDGQQPGTVRVVGRDGELLHRLPVASEYLAVDRQGRRVVVTTEPGDVTVWDVPTGRLLHTLVGHVGPVRDAVFSADGSRLATSGEDATVRLWDLRTGEPLQVLQGHESAVLSVRWSPDGRRLVTASADGTVRVWAVALDDLVRLAEQRLTRDLTAEECRQHLPDEDCTDAR